MFMPNDRPRLLIWEREELILAGDLVVRNGWRQIPATDPRVIELSALLRRLPLHPVEDRSPDFRNVNSVARKTADIATNRPGHTGRATNSGAPTKRVIAELTAQPELMHQLALSIRDAEGRGDFEPLTAPVPDEEEGAAEGRLHSSPCRLRARPRAASAQAARGAPGRPTASLRSMRLRLRRDLWRPRPRLYRVPSHSAVARRRRRQTAAQRSFAAVR
jgi:hypothetical protein